MKPLYEVGERVDLLQSIDDSGEFYSGVIVDIDENDSECPYQVEIDKTGRKRWCQEDEIDAQPSAAQVKQFAALVDRVWHKLVSHEENE